MKMRLAGFGLMVFLVFTGASFAAKQPSKISTFAGDYTGTVTLFGSGVAYSGTSNGKFSASKKKEKGSLSLTSFISSGSDSGVLVETFNFKKRTVVYTLNLAGTIATGTGTAHTSKGKISYFATIAFSTLTYVIQGTIRQTKKGLEITEILSASSGSAQINYSLKRRGK